MFASPISAMERPTKGRFMNRLIWRLCGNYPWFLSWKTTTTRWEPAKIAVPPAPIFYTRGQAFGITGAAVDGMDVLAVKNAAATAIAHCRAGNGPYVLEAKTYRYRGHSMSDPAKYRTRDEVQKVRETQDPIDHIKDMLLQGKHADAEALKAIDKQVKQQVQAAADFAIASPEPDVSELYTDIYASA